MKHYIKTMRGHMTRARGYGSNGYELAVTVQFDSVEFNRLKKTQDPLGVAMPQIKNVILDACGVRGVPTYAHGMRQKYPRASKGLVTLVIYFELSEFKAKELGVSQFVTQNGMLRSCREIDLQTTLDATRNESHLFAKAVLASKFGH